MFQHLTDDELLRSISAADDQPTDRELELATRLAGAVDALEEALKENEALHEELRQTEHQLEQQDFELAKLRGRYA